MPTPVRQSGPAQLNPALPVLLRTTQPGPALFCSAQLNLAQPSPGWAVQGMAGGEVVVDRTGLGLGSSQVFTKKEIQGGSPDRKWRGGRRGENV